MEISASTRRFIERRRIPIRLSCILPSGYPLVISLWYHFDDEYIYAITEKSSKLFSYLEKNNLVGFEIAGDEPPYCGIRGYGSVELYPDEVKAMTKRIYSKYFQNTDTRLYDLLVDPHRQEMVIRISPQNTFTWNFEERMADTEYKNDIRTCP